MKIEIEEMSKSIDKQKNFILFSVSNMASTFASTAILTSDQIEDLEINLTDIIKQLQDYRMKQNHD